MSKFRVDIITSYFAQLIVDASDEDDACDKAHEIINKLPETLVMSGNICVKKTDAYIRTVYEIE